ncbi:V-type ATPase subunit D [Penicillium concentricum]|uniref:V-type proton ATPase subunit D n=1 Tax=Penicillium concentricum TaxID=293559 RepID=A0A9W9R9U0_9EURO|nr:V-type ATPase subunit D [Penicillium concentricum]KAJ5356226.1 V-type ATPase subunit D [Penicillium concentricum]
MSGAVGREAVFPTRQSLGLMKNKLKGAEIGHSLLKRKSEALTKRFRDITRRIDEAKQKMGRVMQIAAFSLAEVSYAVGGDIGYQIQESAKQARFRVRAKQENVSGVLLPTFESYTQDGVNDFGLTGLGKGGQQIQRCRETYARAVETLVELASLQTAFLILDEVIKVVNRRVNAIEHVIIPRTENTIKCLYRLLQVPLVQANHSEDINSELDELDREEFYRLKKVSGKKQRDVAAADAEILAARQKAAEEQAANPKVPAATAIFVQEEESTDVLGEQEDNDVIF